MRKLEPEGSLYLVERAVKPLFKLVLLNRKPNNDLIDFLTEDTEFTEQDCYVAYSTKVNMNVHGGST